MKLRSLPWWDQFKRKKRPEWLSFAEAKAVVRAHGIKTYTQFEAWDNQERLTNRIPSNPNIAYRNAGWTNSYDFFSTASPPSRQHVQTAERLAAEHGILPSRQWLLHNGHPDLYHCM